MSDTTNVTTDETLCPSCGYDTYKADDGPRGCLRCGWREVVPSTGTVSLRCTVCGHDSKHTGGGVGLCCHESGCICDGRTNESDAIDTETGAESDVHRDYQAAADTAASAYRLFTAYQRVGFSEEQAMRLLVAVIESGAW